MTEDEFDNANVRKPKIIPLVECKQGFLYRVSARNFNLGVYIANGFIGIREKFGNSYLDTEYHWDTGAPFGTAWPTEELCQIPEEIKLAERGPLIDSKTGQEVARSVKNTPESLPAYYFMSTRVIDKDIDPVWSINKSLFDWLEEKGKEYEQHEAGS